MNVNFTVHDVVREVRAIAKDQPDFYYTRQRERPLGSHQCGYAGADMHSTEGVGCIVGQALGRLGLSLKQRLDLDGVGDAYSVMRDLDLVTSDGDRDAAYWLLAVQERQDAGESFGVAVSRPYA